MWLCSGNHLSMFQIRIFSVSVDMREVTDFMEWKKYLFFICCCLRMIYYIFWGHCNVMSRTRVQNIGHALYWQWKSKTCLQVKDVRHLLVFSHWCFFLFWIFYGSFGGLISEGSYICWEIWIQNASCSCKYPCSLSSNMHCCKLTVQTFGNNILIVCVNMRPSANFYLVS